MRNNMPLLVFLEILFLKNRVVTISATAHTCYNRVKYTFHLRHARTLVSQQTSSFFTLSRLCIKTRHTFGTSWQLSVRETVDSVP